MVLSKEGRFFPNECYICKSTTYLTTCSCNMISYCGEEHKLQHRPIHQSFCEVITKLLKEKNISHIYEVIQYISNESIWLERRNQLFHEVTTKLMRNLTRVEYAMLIRPKICYICRKATQKDLKKCPNCPIASFCKLHLGSSMHTYICNVMTKYLNLLKAAAKLNVDLQFLPSSFPFVNESKNININDDILTQTSVSYNASTIPLRNENLSLCNFIISASKLYSALQKIYDTIPSELIIHIDAPRTIFSIVKYWEFFLHLNPIIKLLKIVIIGEKESRNFGDSLCEKCRSTDKMLFIEVHSMTYEEYVLEEYYQKPDFLYEYKIDDKRDSTEINKWSKIVCPIILTIDSEEIFNETKRILEFLSSKFHIIYSGKISTPFSENLANEKENFIIFKLKEIKAFIKFEIDNSSIGEISFFKKENEGLRVHLNSLVERNNKLEKRILELEESCSKLVKKSKLIREAACDIDVNVSSVLDKNEL